LLVEQLLPFGVLCGMRERTPLTPSIIERLPKLRMIASTGSRNRSIDTDAARERGIVVSGTGHFSESTVELTFTLQYL
jgi:phosphoglycerate dehydrogenase-like enzyme